MKKRRELLISEILKQLGAPANQKGYYYLKAAIDMFVEDQNLINAITKKLYPELGVRFGVKPMNVERGIRHTIETMWSRGDINLQNRIFGFSVSQDKGKPTNGQFIAGVAEYIVLNYRIDSICRSDV